MRRWREGEGRRHGAVEQARIRVLVRERHERGRRPIHDVRRHRLAARAVNLALDVERVPLVSHHHERHRWDRLRHDGRARRWRPLTRVLGHVTCEIRLLRVRLAAHPADMCFQVLRVRMLWYVLAQALLVREALVARVAAVRPVSHV